jgi:hypothetical protein
MCNERIVDVYRIQQHVRLEIHRFGSRNKKRSAWSC